MTLARLLVVFFFLFGKTAFVDAFVVPPSYFSSSSLVPSCRHHQEQGPAPFGHFFSGKKHERVLVHSFTALKGLSTTAAACLKDKDNKASRPSFWNWKALCSKLKRWVFSMLLSLLLVFFGNGPPPPSSAYPSSTSASPPVTRFVGATSAAEFGGYNRWSPQRQTTTLLDIGTMQVNNRRRAEVAQRIQEAVLVEDTIDSEVERLRKEEALRSKLGKLQRDCLYAQCCEKNQGGKQGGRESGFKGSSGGEDNDDDEWGK